MPALKNAKKEKFVQCLIAGMSQRKAYLEAFPSAARWKSNTVDSRAYELFHTSEVLGRFSELQERAARGAVLTRQRKREILCTIAESEENEPRDRIRAIDTDNRMEGEYTEKVEVKATDNNLFAQLEESLNELRTVQPEAAVDAAVVETAGTESV